MPKSLSFPKDELSHPAVIEWWYFNGNLKDESQKQYTYMYCLFKADPKKIKLPFLEKVPLQNLYFSHYLVSDISAKKSQSGIEFFYEGLDDQSFSKDLIFVKTKNKSKTHLLIEESKPSNYALKMKNLDLKLASSKPPLLVNEIGWIDLKTKNTYYYSFTNLETKGKIILEDQEIQVSGKSWMDHQWAENPYSSEDKWVWFSLQLDNQTEILCFEYGDKVKTRLASISYPDGSQKSTNVVNFKPLGKTWTSPKTQAIYNLEWEIDIPEWGVKLKASPKVLEQEVIFGTINYWEGGMNIEGEFNGSKALGEGFLEMVGTPMGKPVSRIYMDRAKELLSDYMARP